MKRWKSIDSAPREGTEILAREGKSAPEFVHWRSDQLYAEGGFWATRDSGLPRRLLPTIWTPIPTDDETITATTAEREAVARAICLACEERPDHRGDARGNEYRWQDYLPVADATLQLLANSWAGAAAQP